MSQVTEILSQIGAGNPQAAERLLPLVYEELRRLASSYLDHERPGHTLQPTALVHDAYLRLVDVDQAARWDSRGHFFAAAAEAMRRLLVENARRKRRLKRGGGLHRVELQEVDLAVEGPSLDILALDEALSKLADKDAQLAELVKLRYFAGLTVQQAAATLGMSTSTADRHWTYARAWLYRELRDDRELETTKEFGPSDGNA